MKTLLMFFLLVSPTLAFSQKVKDVEGLKVPKGLTATQDSLENRITIKSSVYSHFAASNPYNPLSLRIVVTGKGITPVFDIYCFGSSWVYMEEAAIYVKNKDIEKYSFPIEDKGSNVLSWAGSTYVVEDSSIIDSKSTPFCRKMSTQRAKLL